MYALMATSSPFAFAYCIAIAILGGFFVVNLFLAVILTEFLDSIARIEAEKALEREGKGRKRLQLAVRAVIAANRFRRTGVMTREAVRIKRKRKKQARISIMREMLMPHLEISILERNLRLNLDGRRSEFRTPTY